jgi:ribosomal protein L32
LNSGVDTNTKVIAVTKTYRVLLLGRIEEKQDFEEKMEKLGFSPLGEAREYAEAIQEAGGRVNIQEDGVSEEFNRLHPPIEIRSLQDFTMCPECGHRQIKAQACEKCGFVFFFEKKGQRSAR